MDSNLLRGVHLFSVLEFPNSNLRVAVCMVGSMCKFTYMSTCVCSYAKMFYVCYTVRQRGWNTIYESSCDGRNTYG